MRSKFDEQLERLHVELIRMGSLCEEAISLAAKAVQGVPNISVEKINSLESEIDQMEHDIETRCMRMLLQQQPVAKDLRTVSAALKMISDLERIGDQAADIADLVPHISGKLEQNPSHIGDMARAAVSMVIDSVDAFVKQDLDLVHYVIESDDIVDNLFNQVKDELLNLIRTGANHPETILDLLMIAKYFERIGDHAVNVAEWVEYSITGINKMSES